MSVDRELDQLAALDRRLERLGPGPNTLDPGRERATPTAALVPAPNDAAPSARRAALARGLFEVVEAWLENFPENIFWDLDLLARALWRLGEPIRIERRAGRIAELARGFGRQTAIRFQYVHDFSYGFDWARWVARDPEEREAVGPFDGAFLAHLEKRQAELLDLISKDDAQYPTLHGGQPRNPFGFSRTKPAERTLLRALAAEGAIPVQTWRPDGACTWDRPFARIREEKARELGLADA